MTISNRLLMGVALASGLAVVALTWTTPVAHSIEVLRASEDLHPHQVLTVGQNVEPVRITVYKFSQLSGAIPMDLKNLVHGRQLTHDVTSGDYVRLDHLVSEAQPVSVAGEKGQKNFLQLSSLLESHERAISLRSDDLNSFDRALQPGDFIDIIWAGGRSNEAGERIRNVRVLTVGCRALEGWVCEAPREPTYRTITLAVDSGQSDRVAGMFSARSSEKPRVVLMPGTAESTSLEARRLR